GRPWTKMYNVLLFGAIWKILREMLPSAVHQAIHPVDKLRKAGFEQERIANLWNSIPQVGKDESLCPQDGKDYLNHEPMGILRIKFLEVNPVLLNHAQAIFVGS